MDHRGKYAGLHSIVEYLIPYSMTQEEFRQKDLELLEEIAGYNASNCDCEAEIALNNKKIVELDLKRIKLRQEFDRSE